MMGARRAARVALALVAWAAEPAAAALFDGPVRVRASPPDPHGYPGLQLQVTAGPGAEESFLLWPQEGISVGRDFEFVRRDRVAALERRADGSLAYRVAGLRAPGISFEVEVMPAAGALEVRYRLRNEGDAARFLSVAPCFQLPEAFSERDGWARAKDVLLPTAELGWRWIADAHATRGVALGPDDPEPGRAPWSQHFHAAAHDHARSPHDANRGLALFGVASEHVTHGFVAAVRRRDGAFVALAADAQLGVAYAFVNCLHAGVGRRLGPGERAEVVLRVLFHRGDWGGLLARVEREVGLSGLPRPDAGFVAPDARERVIESFEDGVGGWRARGGEVTATTRGDPFLAPTHGARELEVHIAPGGRVASPPLDAGAAPQPAAQLSVDVALPADAGPARAELRVISGDGAVARTEAALAPGRYRRLVVPLGETARPPLRVELALPGAARAGTLLLDAVTLHGPGSARTDAPP